MPSRITKAANIFFIAKTSVQGLEETANGLSHAAQKAYTNRNFALLDSAATALMELSPATELHGQLYKALAISKLSAGDKKASIKIFENLAESNSSPIRAASFLAIGLRELRCGKNKQALKLISHASTLINPFSSPITFFGAQNALSTYMAKRGDYLGSIQILKRLKPFADSYGRIFPALVGELYNNLACGYLDLGEPETAFYYSTKAMANSASLNYPEWFETGKEIEGKLAERRTESVALPDYHPKLHRKDFLKNVRLFPSPKLLFQIYLTVCQGRYKLLNYEVNSSSESEVRFTALLRSLALLCDASDSPLRIEGFFEQDESLKFGGNLSEGKLVPLFTTVKNVREYERENPLPIHIDDGEETARHTLEWFLHLIERTERIAS
jgi:tetratricopeptide (TPR) repeat protein